MKGVGMLKIMMVYAYIEFKDKLDTHRMPTVNILIIRSAQEV